MIYEITNVQTITIGNDAEPPVESVVTVVEVEFKDKPDGKLLNSSRLDLQGTPTDEEIVERIVKRGKEIKDQQAEREFTLPKSGSIE